MNVQESSIAKPIKYQSIKKWRETHRDEYNAYQRKYLNSIKLAEKQKLQKRQANAVKREVKAMMNILLN